MNSIASKRYSFAIMLSITALLLAAAVTYAQVNSLGIHFLRAQQEKVHLQMMQGIAGNPWQYRILADVLIDPLIKLLKGVGIPQPESFSFIAFRFLQCLFILVVGGIYYRRLGLILYENLIGLSILAWGMSYALYNSDLSFNVFFDVGFYLLAAILILNNKYWWLVLLMVPATLNRETSLLIPFMLFFAVRSNVTRENDTRGGYLAAGISLLVYVAISVGLRVYYGQQQFLTADGYYPGIGLLVLNIQRWATWEQLLITLGVIPLLALFAHREWPKILVVFFWVIVPVWFAVHFVAALVAETRLVLVPQALVFIPAALVGLVAARRPMSKVQTQASTPG
jgi:hypothetical protein